MFAVNYCTKMYFKPGHFKSCSLHKYRHHRCQISGLCIAVATRPRQTVLSCAFILKFEWRQTYFVVQIFHYASGLGCLMASFWSCPSDRRFPHCRRQSFPTIILWEKHWQRDRIYINGLNEWCRQKNKTPTWNCICWLNCCPFLSSVFLFQKCCKAPTKKYSFPTTTKYSWCFFHCLV